MVSGQKFLTWTLVVLAHVLLIVFTPGFAALVPVAVFGVPHLIGKWRVKRQMRAELRQIVGNDD